MLARTLLLLGQPDKVTKELAKVELSSPEARAEMQTALAQAYLMQGKNDLAETALAPALAAQPAYAPALLGQARLKASQKDLPGAVPVLEAALEKSQKLYEGWPVSYTHLGVYKRQGWSRGGQTGPAGEPCADRGRR